MTELKQKKIIYFSFLFSVFISLVLYFLFYNTIQNIKKINVKNYTIKNLEFNNSEYPYYIDYSTIKNNKFYVNILISFYNH